MKKKKNTPPALSDQPPALVDQPPPSKKQRKKEKQPKGPTKVSAKEYNNQEATPIMRGEIEDRVAPAPLHVDLGLIKQWIDYLTELALMLDRQVHAHQAIPPTTGSTHAANITTLTMDLLECQRATATARADLEVWQVMTAACVKKHGMTTLVRLGRQLAAKKKNSARPALSPVDEQIYLEYQLSHEGREARMIVFAAALASSSSKSDELNLAIKASWGTVGPFSALMNALLNILSLERQKYHGGAFVGNDCAKIMRPAVRMALSMVFAPRQFTDPNGNLLMIPRTHALQDSVAQLLGKYSLCRDLHAPSHMLCRHEVWLLLIRATSLGNWVPTTFTMANHYPSDMAVPPKFHIAVVEMPLFAAKHFTVGMAAEHVVEVMHKRVNHHSRVFCAVAGTANRMAVVAKQIWMESDPNIGNFNMSVALRR
jgi:hypothetical protein